MATKTTKNSFAHGGKTIYLNNKELLQEVCRCKEKGEMSNTLARMLQLMCARYAKKGNFVNYSYNEDMQAYAMMMLVRTWNSFNPEKSDNPFAFFTQCIKNSFIQYLNQEQRQRDIRDVLLIDQGLNPSYGYENDEDGPRIQDERDYVDAFKIMNDASTRERHEDVPIERDEKGVEIIPDDEDLPDDIDEGNA